MLQSLKRRICWSFCEVIYSKIQRTSLLPRKWLTHLADRIHNTEKFYYSSLRYKIQYEMDTSYLGTTESFFSNTYRQKLEQRNPIEWVPGLLTWRKVPKMSS
jgi:hypothetical protein